MPEDQSRRVPTFQAGGISNGLMVSVPLPVLTRLLYDQRKGQTWMGRVDGSNILDWASVRPDLVRFLTRRTGCADTAEDIAQELWLKVERPAQERGDPRSPLSYLFRAAANAALDWHRRERVRGNADADDLASVVDEQPSAERVAAGRQSSAVFEAAIAELPPKCRQAFLLCRVEGLTMREAGRRMGVSERTVENHLAKATLHCRRKLIEAGAWP
jgi:RNA polymerase sigma factor (sigma-70 family)